MRILCILMLLVFSNIILAQSSIPVPWEKQYNYQEYDFAADICAGHGGGAVIVGGDWEDTNYTDMRCRVTRLSSSGRVLWTTWLDFGDNYPVYEGICHNEFRQSYVTVGTHDFNESDRELIFGEFSEWGRLVRTNWYDDYERGLDIIQLPDGGYAALVLKYGSSCLGAYVMRTDHLFNMDWECRVDDLGGMSVGAFDECSPGNGLCLSLDGNSIITAHTTAECPVGIPPYDVWFVSTQINSYDIDTGEIASGWFSIGYGQFVGVEHRPTAIGYYTMFNDAPYCIPWGENLLPYLTGEHITVIGLNENLQWDNLTVTIEPPVGYDEIRAYEFERYSGGYMITGMVKDASDQWHMWIGITNNSFELQDSFYGSANTGSFGEVLSSCNQMGGCVTEGGHFMAAGAEYLPNGHTNYNVMFESYGNIFDSGDVSFAEPGTPARSTDGLSVHRNSDLNHFSIQFHGEISGEPVADVYNICGRKVTTLHGTRDTESSVSFTFDGSSSEGCQLPSGVYVVTVNTGNSIEAATFTLLQ